MNTWSEICQWRRQERKRLVDLRFSIRSAEKRIWDDRISTALHELLLTRRLECVGYYWPFRREPDMRDVVTQIVERGGSGALPVVVEKKQPLEFWTWHAGDQLEPGIWKILVPAKRTPVIPTVLIVPLLGHDSSGYRLGYGGGYYDRTLAAAKHKPLCIGVGYSHAKLDTIYPQPHDIAMDVLVTENGIIFD